MCSSESTRKVLSSINRATHAHMALWWQRYGIYWITAILVIWFIDTASYQLAGRGHVYPDLSSLTYDIWPFTRLLKGVIPVVAFVAASSHKLKLLEDHILNDGIPTSFDVRRHSFSIVVYAGIPILLVVLAAGSISWAYVKGRLTGMSFPDWYYAICLSIEQVSASALISLIAVAIMCMTRSKSSLAAILFIMMLHHLNEPFVRLSDSRGTYLYRMEDAAGLSPFLFTVGSVSAIVLLAVFLLTISSPNFRLSTTPLVAICIIRGLETYFGYRSLSNLDMVVPDIAFMAILRGFQLVFVTGPMNVDVTLFPVPDEILAHPPWNPYTFEGTEWNYLYAVIGNLAWVACVFLFCRWAVGRSAGREA
ncbi:MAG: hypothetical protein H7A35_16590 [Planctomycetales bacterium]|nr:hypothetical protein [bacterium]UNM08445.1 MAG: hypothetical protein H7A35_16590 [Planctomycetales bacterium]